jgi:HEPN domain-containing protein
MQKLTAEWVQKAEVDVKAAQRLFQEKPPLNDPACFHCQQAAEKYLKALLQELGLPVPKIHDLDDLLDDLLPHDPTLAALRAGLNRLTEYAVDYRYPGVHATSRRTRSALRVSQQVRQSIRKRLGLRTRK